MKHWVAARQIGKTHVLALEVALVAALGREGPLAGKRALIISKDDDSSKEVLRDCVKWIRVLQDAGIVGFDGDPIAGMIRLTNGCQIVSIPGGRPEASRGPSGSVWLDEAPYHRDLMENYSAATGVTTRGGLLRMVSTPIRDNDLFWDIRVNRGGIYGSWTRHFTTIHDALACGILKPNDEPLTLEELRRKMPLKERFMCEYECIPLSDVMAYFTLALIDKCIDLYDPEFTSGHLYGGYDVAVSPGGDLTAIMELRRDGDKYQGTRVVLAERGIEDPDDQEGYAAQVFQHGDWKRMCIDAGGVGYGVAKRLAKKFGSHRCEGVTFTLDEKQEMMTNLHELMEQGRLALPPDDDLRLDLYSIKREFTESGKQKFTADVTSRGHADRAWALALALRAAGKAVPTATVRSQVRSRRRPREPLY